MTLKEFDSLTIRDFENGAVMSEIRNSIKELNYALKEIENLASEVGHYKALYYGMKESQAQREATFIKHIQNHIGPQEFVVCKICGKTVGQIYTDSKGEKK